MNIKISAVTLLFIAGIMAVSNPDRQDYIDYSSSRFVQEIPQSICQGDRHEQDLGQLSQNLVNLCSSGLGWALTFNQQTVTSIVDSNTRRYNFLLFSIYTTKIPDYNFKTIGILGNFITFAK
jgi:hypothetical protein